MTTTKPGRLREAINATAAGMHRAGIMDAATFEQITLWHMGAATPPTAEPISGGEVRKLREQAHLSRAALARYLNLPTGYISQLERATRQAKGPALAPLNVIRRKGIEALL